MKNSNLIIVVMLLLFCFSCTNQEDNFKQYLTEDVFPGKTSAIRSSIGIEKVYLAWEAPTDAKAERMVVKYSDRDSIITETIVDTLVVNGLDAGETYTFEVFSVDRNNNQSVKQFKDLFPVTKDWISKNMALSTPLVLPTDGVNPSSLNFTWGALNNEVMQYKGGLEFSVVDDEGNAVSPDIISVDNNIIGGNLVITIPNLDINKSYTITYKMDFSPKVDNSPILDTTPLSGEFTFIPSDFSFEPIYLLVESKGWDEDSFITLFAIEPGRYVAQNITLKAGDVMRAFEDRSLTSEEQYGFSHFNTLPSILGDDGNDNLQLNVTNDDQHYNLLFEIDGKSLSLAGTFNGLIAIPGNVEVEDFNVGGQGNGYNDTSEDNRGAPDNRPDDFVDIDAGPAVGGFHIGWTDDGEWLKYTIEVLETGTYQVDLNVGSPNDTPGSMAILINGSELTSCNVINTGGWQTYKLLPTLQDIELTAGIHELQLLFREPGFNIDSLIFTKK